MAAEHPGVFLRTEVTPSLRAAGIDNAKLAALLGLSRGQLQEILAGRSAITKATAARLGALFGEAFGVAALCQQAQHDLAQARAQLAGELARLPDLSRIPLKLTGAAEGPAPAMAKAA